MNFEDLFEKCKKSLYFIALNILKNRDDADEVLQETAYMAFKGFNRLNDQKMFKTWITRILLNNCNKSLRKIINRKDKLGLEDIEEIWIDEINEDESIILKAMTCLNKKEKLVVILRYSNDLKFEDIAKCMNISINTIKSIHYRSLTKLKKFIELEDGQYVY